MVPAECDVPGTDRRGSIVFGLIMNMMFSMAATFLALKAGQGIETAIPISILAVGLSGFLLKAGRRGSTILENVYILSISTTSGYVAGGTVLHHAGDLSCWSSHKPRAPQHPGRSLFLQIAWYRS